MFIKTGGKADLMIVMPVYNEQASVRKVVMEWFQEVENGTGKNGCQVIT